MILYRCVVQKKEGVIYFAYKIQLHIAILFIIFYGYYLYFSKCSRLNDMSSYLYVAADLHGLIFLHLHIPQNQNLKII